MTARQEHAGVACNADIADRLDEVANLLEEHAAGSHRVAAWRRGAATVRALDTPVHVLLLDEGMEALDRLPGIGTDLARAVRDLVEIGRLPLLEWLRDETQPEALSGAIPGIGDRYAR